MALFSVCRPIHCLSNIIDLQCDNIKVILLTWGREFPHALLARFSAFGGRVLSARVYELRDHFGLA